MNQIQSEPTDKKKMFYKAVDVTQRSTPKGIFVVTTSLEGRPTKAVETNFSNELRLTLLDTKAVNPKSSKQKIEVHGKGSLRL